MRLKTDFPRDEPLILRVLFPLLQLIAFLPITKFKLSTTENPRGCTCQEPAPEIKKKQTNNTTTEVQEQG